MASKLRPVAAPLAGCDTMVVRGDASATGVTLFAKNSDRPPGEAQVLSLVERASHPNAARVRCQYIDIPQVRETARVLASRPVWLWGFELGVNEHGVAIGNETIFAHEAPAHVGLTGMDLVRLGLERAGSAKTAVAVLIELIETHGQGGSGYRDVDWPYNNSFLIADARDAWILEAAGRHWAERRARSVDSISNQICIASDWDRLSAQAVERARECGFAVRDPFDFAAAYRDVDSVPRVLSEGRLRRSRALLSQGRGKLTPVLLREILRDHDRTGPHYIAGASPEEEQYYTLCMHQGPSRTAASVVAELTADRREPQTAWLSFGRPCASVYFPLVVAGRLPESLREGSETPGDTLWWVFERLAAQAEASDAHAKRIRAVFDDLEAAFADELDGLRRYTARLDAREQDDAATRFMDGVAARVESTARELVAAGT